MPANVETMAYVKFSERDVPWHSLGTPVDHAMNSKEALELSGQDWIVRPMPMFININGKPVEVPNVIANTRSLDNTVLGTVTGRYKIVQNHEAFAFTDALLGEGVKYETAGVLDNGKRVWILAKMNETEILDDKIEQYLVFTNSHDGKGSIRVACTPVRVVCSNTLSAALHSAKRSWSTKHMGNIETKMAEAHRTLELASKYMDALKIEAEKLAQIPFSKDKFTEFVERLIPIANESSSREKNNALFLRNDLNQRYNAPDLENFKNTKYAVFNCLTDFASHRPAVRVSNKYKEKVFESIIDGNKYLDKGYSLLQAM